MRYSPKDLMLFYIPHTQQTYNIYLYIFEVFSDVAANIYIFNIFCAYILKLNTVYAYCPMVECVCYVFFVATSK